MRVEQLVLSNFRGQRNLTLRFQPGFNLIVGVNGAGKTTILEALRILLARILPGISMVKTFPGIGLTDQDITIGRSSVFIEANFKIEDISYSLTLSEQRKKIRDAVDAKLGVGSVADIEELVDRRKATRLQKGDQRLEGTIRGQTSAMPEVSGEIYPAPGLKLKLRSPKYLVLYCSVRRAFATEKTPRPGSSVSPYQSAFDAERGFELGRLVQWWKGREEIAQEDPTSISAKQLATIKFALGKILPELSNWRIEDDTLKLDKVTDAERINSAGKHFTELELVPIPANFLSDGERSLLAICVDIAQRLVLLNENSETPLDVGEGVVLIDELDLHLHPKWQRRIVEDLRRTFPKLQFICTTHSPQIIGQVASEEIILLGVEGEGPKVPQSFGMDSNWVLRHIMGSDDRDSGVTEKLDKIFEEIEAGNFDTAEDKVVALRKEIGEHPDLVEAQALISRYTRFSESGNE